MDVEAKRTELRVLLIGLEPASDELIAGLGDFEIDRVTTSDEFAEKFESWNDETYFGIFCGPAISDLSSLELAQTLNNQCPNTSKLFVTTQSEGFQVKKLIKNGFQAAFKLPIDNDILKLRVSEARAERLGQKVFKPVKVLDLGGDDELSFETYVFLPLNKKNVRFSRAGEKFDSHKLAKLDKHSVHSVMVDKKDLPQFYQHTAKSLKTLASGGGSGGSMSETERKERLAGAVREMVLELFDVSSSADIAGGREIKEKSDQIIQNYISGGGSADIYKRLTSAMNVSADGYDHISSVATLAALIAMGLGHAHPEDLAMAGLFHEMGLSNFAPEVFQKPQDEWTDEQKAAYASYPENSVRMVKEKRIVISPAVEKAIVQHQERFDGKGFPKALPAVKICEEAQILSFASQFDQVTRTEEGKARLSAVEAVEKIRETKSISPLLLDRIKVLLEKAA